MKIVVVEPQPTRISLQLLIKEALYNNSNKWHLEGNGTPLQYSCLENPMDGGAW